MTRSAVELGHQLTVCGAGGFDVLVPFSEFAAKVENLLFQVGGAACERLDVGRGAEAGGFPSCLSQGLGQAPFEPGDVRGQLPITGREVRDVGQQRLAADLRSGSRAGRRLARAGDDGRVQVSVAVNQAAVHADIVAALLEDEATVKVLRRHGGRVVR
ncbi:hypothetical protein [Streptomyces avermitilis]|uniref:hypothetical protein n=1 Tax=Streptomyces avermitilis TaxID=33903 RepID=UPI0033A0871E